MFHLEFHKPGIGNIEVRRGGGDGQPDLIGELPRQALPGVTHVLCHRKGAVQHKFIDNRKPGVLFSGTSGEREFCCMATSLDVSFKGNRDYLQSADIINAVVAKTGAASNLRVKFIKLLTSSIEMVPAAEVAQPTKAPARFSGVTSAGKEIDVVIRPAAVATALKRVPYDEESVIASSTLGENYIEDSNGKSATLLERIVALNKRLVHVRLSPGKKLLFTAMNLSHMPASPHLRLELRSHVGVRIFRSAIISEGKELGDLWFYGV